jgi:stalled ribosome rescue protein Dom34
MIILQPIHIADEISPTLNLDGRDRGYLSTTVDKLAKYPHTIVITATVPGELTKRAFQKKYVDCLNCAGPVGSNSKIIAVVVQIN